MAFRRRTDSGPRWDASWLGEKVYEQACQMKSYCLNIEATQTHLFYQSSYLYWVILVYTCFSQLFDFNIAPAQKKPLRFQSLYFENMKSLYMYSRISMTRTLMAHSPGLARTIFMIPRMYTTSVMMPTGHYMHYPPWMAGATVG